MKIKGAFFVELFGVYCGLICSSTTLSSRLFARQILEKSSVFLNIQEISKFR
ncbi:hypothetical protein MtrunA17_Chr3g0102461 [Medicago truncatula]|uniref:Uncharacterized protein n=1 Tax=Medicago truncatula TaxID=3880 RepID=A0A396IPA5_MEDTR|nr:hypothetical protein MtrunA17_Chr3g0102461 [Medicago truncatula]